MRPDGQPFDHWSHRIIGDRILELTSQADLDQEGLRLSHCVGGYTEPCLAEGSGIYAVRDAIGQSRSTFEVKMTEVGRSWFSTQPAPMPNRPPPNAIWWRASSPRCSLP